MARFYADIQGNRGEASRMGTALSGISAHPRGWGLGIKVNGGDNVKGYGDEFNVTITGGSNGARGNALLANVCEDADGYVRVELSAKFGGAVLYVDRDGDVYYVKPRSPLS
jgi:hypothetical protein